MKYRAVENKLNSLKRQNLVVKMIHYVNEVVGNFSIPETMFEEAGNRSPHVSSWRLSACGRQIAHLTTSTTRTMLYVKVILHEGHFTCGRCRQICLNSFCSVAKQLLTPAMPTCENTTPKVFHTWRRVDQLRPVERQKRSHSVLFVHGHHPLHFE